MDQQKIEQSASRCKHPRPSDLATCLGPQVFLQHFVHFVLEGSQIWLADNRI